MVQNTRQFSCREQCPLLWQLTSSHLGELFQYKRVKTLQISVTLLLNADVNGALNIMRKSSVVSSDALYGRGVVDTPMRIRVA